MFTRRDIELGEKARSVLENEAFSSAYDQLRESYLSQLINTAGHETEKRERAYVCVRLLEEIKSNLGGFMTHGKLAMQHLDKINRR
jgi:hypothetical protein